MKWQIYVGAIVLALLVFYVINNKNAFNDRKDIVNDGTTNFLYSKTFAIGYYPVQYRYGITNNGNIQHDVDVGGKLDFQTVRLVGASASTKYIDVSTTNTCKVNYDWTAENNNCNTLDTFFCTMRYIREQEDQQFQSYSLFASCEVLATTSEKNDTRTYNLVSTYKGLGILIVPRGASLTQNLFLNGFTPLFDDIEYQRCAQRDQNFSLYTDNSSYALFKPYYEGFNPRPFSCGKSCIPVFPPPEKNLPIIWSLQSDNGQYVLEFRDDGHVFFRNKKARFPIFSTEFDFLQCSPVVPTEYINSTALENVRDRYILKGTSLSYNNGNTNPTVIANQTDIIQITDQGTFMHGKDYIYLGEKSHPMVQSIVGQSNADFKFDAYNVYGQIINPKILGVAPFSDINNVHWNAMVNVACSGMDFANQWELDQGLAISYSNVISNTNSARDGKRYVLWFGTFGLRLLLCQGSTPKLSEMAWDNCLWITRPYVQALYLWNLYDADLVPFGYPTTGNPQSKFSYDPNYPGRYIPQEYDSTNPYCQTNGYNNFPPPPATIYSCGNFLAPISSSSDVIFKKLSSPNKQYAFYFMSSGACYYVNHQIPDDTTKFSSDKYVPCK